MKHSAREPVQVLISEVPTLHEAVILFRDNGIPSKTPKKMGNLFEKGPRSQGAGVGLYLVQSLMKHMGGRAEFHSHADGFEARLYFQLEKAGDDS